MDLLSYAFYAFYIAGSVTLGYLLLRLTYPEIRLLPLEQKLGTGVVSGAMMTISALTIDFFYDDKLEVLGGNGIYPIIAFMLFLLSFVFLKLYFIFSKPEFLTVGVPVDRPISIQITKTLDRPEQEKEVYERIVGNRQGSDIRDKSGERKKELLDKLRKEQVQLVSEEAVQLSKQDNIFSSIMGMLSGKRESRVELDEMKKTKAMPVPFQPRKPIAKPQMERIPSVALAEQKAAPPGIQIALKPEENATRKGFMGMVGDILSGKKEEAKVAERKLEPQKPQASEAIQKIRDDAKQENVLPRGPERSIEDIKKDIANRKDEEPLTPEMIPRPRKPIPLAEGENEALLGMKSEIMKDQPLEIPKREVKEEGESKFKSDPKLLEEQKRKAEEAQAELILTEILPKDVLDKPLQVKPVAGQHRMYQAVQMQQAQLPPGAVIHRRYMMKGGEPAEAPSNVSVFASNDTAQQENFDLLVSDVYTQLKANKSDGIKENLSVAPPKAASSMPAGKAELSFEDLLGEKAPENKEGAASSPKSSVLSQLTDIADASGKPEVKTDIAFVKIEAEKGMGCPTCHSKNSKIIFCPYCGTGMCANCSPSIKIKEGTFVYTCPKCKEDVDVRKKMQQPAGAAA